MILIVGLGNPGEKYANTRHNAGFMFVNYMAKHAEAIKQWKFDKYVSAEVAVINLQTKKIHERALLAKPQTFMNKSGDSVLQLLKKNNIEPAHLIVAHDDLDLELGNFKIQRGTGPKVHNGIFSIEEVLGSKDFLRIRIGVDNRLPTNRIPGEDYVLSNFTTDEILTIKKVFDKIEKLISFSVGLDY